MDKIMQKQYFIKCKIHLINVFILMLIVFAFFISNVNAQMFDDDNVAQDVAQDATQVEETVAPEKKDLQQKSPAVTMPAKRKMPSRLVKNKTVGNKQVAVKEVQEANLIDPNEKIYMYMRDFKISHSINGMISCSMRFYLYSKVKEKINNVSYRLKWPKIETPLSFSNVETETPIYKDYTLLGDGCYDLDAAPNIIVNRCRIKGRTQQHCSSIIQWTK